VKSYAVVSVGTVMYVLGGILADRTNIASTLKFDSTRGTWSNIAPMPERKIVFAACAIDSAIYIVRGDDLDGNAQTSVFKLDTETNEWSTHASTLHLS
jgi:hypothetical protein